MKKSGRVIVNKANVQTYKGICVNEQETGGTKTIGYYEKMAIISSGAEIGNRTMILGAPGKRCTRCGGSGREPSNSTYCKEIFFKKGQ